jgi:hypothetical protein
MYIQVDSTDHVNASNSDAAGRRELVWLRILDTLGVCSPGLANSKDIRLRGPNKLSPYIKYIKTNFL